MQLILPLILFLFLAFPRMAAAQAEREVIVTVEGQPMRLLVSGTGAPTIVLEAGAGGDHGTWAAAQPQLANLSRVVRYDRLGYGASGPSPRPRTAAVVVEQLRAGLRAANIEPPYVLVGHSFGAAITRVYASRYPTEVAAMVLVDPALENFYSRATVEQPQSYLEQLEEEISYSDQKASETVRREYLAYETSMLQVRVADLPAELPVVLLTATEMELPPALRQLWVDEQSRWAVRHRNVHQILVKCGHRIPQQQPESVTEAVRRVLASPSRKAGD